MDSRTLSHTESHRADRIGWLRAAVLGANDGTISVSSLLVGVASSGASVRSLLLTGIAGLVAGAMSMAAGEYVSVQSQADTENADIERETRELEADPEHELAELAFIYEQRGLDQTLARQVAQQLMAHDALGAHSRDELGITETLRARPIQAALASAASFVAGAIIPIITIALAPPSHVTEIAATASLTTLAILGAVAAYAGGAPAIKGALRVTFWGALAMGITTLIGRLFGTIV